MNTTLSNNALMSHILSITTHIINPHAEQLINDYLVVS